MLAGNDLVQPHKVPERTAPRLAVVVFAGRTTLPWLRILRRGYRHCFVAVATPGGWIVHDPMCHLTEVGLLDPIPVGDLVAHFRREGCATVISELRCPSPRMAPLRPHTCVESVKRILGLHLRWVNTPRQLYKELRCGRET
jgi:hypothetical protein